MVEVKEGPAGLTIPPSRHVDEIADFFKVFGDATRLKILFLLQGGELPVLSIAHELDMQQSTISQQLKLLRATRLVKSRKAGRSIYYSLNDDHIQRILALGVEHYDELFSD
ncbi:MAG: metalloregulator ArsR/SmtB family transcription factor [Sphaerochaetaceae bacterium]|nr:metalloregulator ArsR/SmtB family transcription factor [Sphaerochaetaceae bacterium]